MKSTQILVIGLLIGFIFLFGLINPVNNSLRLTNTNAASTPKPTQDPLVLESGDTQGLMIGAGVIVLIILSGVVIQRVLKPPKPKDQP
jgi:hypothetical protein